MQGARQVALRRARLCLCGWLAAKRILKLLCIHPDEVCKCSGVLHFNIFHQSTKYAELLAPRNPSENPPSFSFLQLFFFINLLQHSQCTEQNCMFFFTVVAATVSRCGKQARVRPQWPSSYDVTRATLPPRLFRHDYVYHVLVRVTRTCITCPWTWTWHYTWTLTFDLHVWPMANCVIELITSPTGAPLFLSTIFRPSLRIRHEFWGHHDLSIRIPSSVAAYQTPSSSATTNQNRWSFNPLIRSDPSVQTSAPDIILLMMFHFVQCEEIASHFCRTHIGHRLEREQMT